MRIFTVASTLSFSSGTLNMSRRRRRSAHAAPIGSTKSERFWHFLHWLPHRWWSSEQIPHTGP